MTDIFTKDTRSWIMSRIRSKNTSIEIAMMGMLSTSGFSYVAHPKITGSPDFVVDGNIALFCDGDFWHGYRYRQRKNPGKAYWRKKILGNIARDKSTSRRLRLQGWSVLRIWEHDIKNNPDKCVRKIKRKVLEKSKPSGSRINRISSGRGQIR